MPRNARYPHRLLAAAALGAATLAMGLTGCKQPAANTYQRSMSEKWGDAVASFKGNKAQDEYQNNGLPMNAPGPKPDEKMTAAQMLEHQGKIDRAITVYEEIVQKEKHRGDVHHKLAQLYDIQSQPEKALKHYKAATKELPKDTNLMCDLGYHHYLFGDTAESEKVLRQAIEKQPTLARAHNNLALVLAKTGKQDEALHEFRTAGADPATAHVNLAYALMWEEHWSEASHQINLALAADPKSQAAQIAQSRIGQVISTVQRGQMGSATQTSFTDPAPAQRGK